MGRDVEFWFRDYHDGQLKYVHRYGIVLRVKLLVILV